MSEKTTENNTAKSLKNMQEDTQKENRVTFGPNKGVPVAQLPWSYRHGAALAVAVTIVSALVATFVGTIVHRVGLRSDVPLGLVLALLIITLSAWSARMRLGAWGLVIHFIVSAGLLEILSSSFDGRTYLMVNGASIFPTWIGANASYVWMYGLWLIQIVMIALPNSWFVIPPRESPQENPHDTANVDDIQNTDENADRESTPALAPVEPENQEQKEEQKKEGGEQ